MERGQASESSGDCTVGIAKEADESRQGLWGCRGTVIRLNGKNASAAGRRHGRDKRSGQKLKILGIDGRGTKATL